MEMIALIVSGLALLAAGVCLYLTMREKKRNQERNADVCNYSDAVLAEAKEFAKKLLESPEHTEAVRKAAEEIVAQAVNEVCEKIAAPYTENNFGLGINCIMNYDPRVALEKQRAKERVGE